MLQGGFTLVQLLVALVVAALLLHLATPAFYPLVQGHRRQVAANELLSGLRSARVAAITEGQRVSLRPIEGDWSRGWQMLVEAEGTDPDRYPVLAHRRSSGVRIVGNHWVGEAVRFNSMGVPAMANGRFHFCDPGEALSHLQVVIAPSGRIRLQAEPSQQPLCEKAP
ncbi:GspH/FimT family protein [Pseudomonas sp. nanlin1]|uniref:GspH/FimT family protein n=1 Tax=Pseudomonas sp. nanlin1 TaxID=3040605 RepID=UPI00388F9E1A